MNKKDIAIVAGIVLVLTVAAAVTYTVITTSNREKTLSSDAGRALSTSESAAYTDLLGNPVVLTDYLGQSLIVFSWASWCPSCATQLQMLETFAANRSDVTVLAINRAEPITTAERFISYHRLTTDGNVTYVLDTTDHFYQTVGGYAAPETVVFSKEGAITHHFRGDISLDTIATTIGGE